MKRFEIICDATIESVLIENLEKLNGVKGYTYLAPVDGNGNRGPRRGNHVWPEENAMVILYLEDEYSQELISLIQKLRERFPNNGIAGFYLQSATEL